MTTTTQATTFCEAFARTAQQHGEEIALRTVDGAVELTWAELAARVEDTAARLAGLGVSRGDTVAMMLTNCPEFHIADLAALRLGATPFSVDSTSPPDQVAHVLRNAGSRIVVTQRAFLGVIAAAREDAPEVEHVVSVGGGALALDDVDPVQLPHAHLADRFFSHYPALLTGSSITCVEDPRTVVAALPQVRPTVWLAVPRIWVATQITKEALWNSLETPSMRAMMDAENRHQALLIQGAEHREGVSSFLGGRRPDYGSTRGNGR